MSNPKEESKIPQRKDEVSRTASNPKVMESAEKTFKKATDKRR